MDLRISFNDEVSTLFPDLNVAFFLISLPEYDSENRRKLAELEIINKVQKKFNNIENLNNHYLKEKYKNFYKAMGLKPKKVSTPIKQAERVLKTGKYKSVFKAIDLCMLVEYTTLVSFQVYDVDKIKGELEFRLADGNEHIIDLHAQEKTCKKGELILVDNEAVLHSVYYGNNCDKSIDVNTNKYLVRLMGIPGIVHEEFQAAIDQFKDMTEPKNSVVISSDKPSQLLNV